MSSKYVLCTAEGQTGNEGYTLPNSSRHELIQVTYSRASNRGPGARAYNQKTGKLGWWSSGDRLPNPCKIKMTITASSTNLIASAELNSRITEAAEACVALVFIYSPTSAFANFAGNFAGTGGFGAEYRIPILGLAERSRDIIGNTGNRRYIELMFDAGHDKWNDRRDYFGNWIEF